jgi:hypothetical protein
VHVNERFVQLLLRQQAAGFPDFRGATTSLTLPISARLLNEAIADALPATAPGRDLQVTPLPGDRFGVRFRIGASACLPPIGFSLAIVQQPVFPDSPSLVLRMEMGALAGFAGPALRFFDALPAGVRLEQDRIVVDLRQILQRRGAADYLDHVDALDVHTVDGAVVVSLRASIRS